MTGDDPLDLTVVRTRREAIKAMRRVQVLPSPLGTVLVVGVTASDEWVAEFRCRDVDFDEHVVADMESRVLAAERRAVQRVP